MIEVEEIEDIRRAYFMDGLSVREIGRKLHHGRRLIRKAITDPGPYQYHAATSPCAGPGALSGADRSVVGGKRTSAPQAAVHGAQDLPADPG